MKKIPTLVRSVLYIPCDRLRAMQKVPTLRPDVVIFDLEDAVSPENKAAARENLRSFLTDANTVQRLHSYITVRVNCRKTTGWGYDDLKTLRDIPGIDAVVLPKVDNANSIALTSQHIGRSIPLWCMIETAQGIQNVDDISSSPEVAAIVFGSNDLMKDLQARSTASRLPLLYSMSKCIVAARSSKKIVLDGVYMDINDEGGLKEDCLRGKDLGFDGKTLIHPNQIKIANEIFSPSPDDIKLAKRIISTYNEAIKAGKSLGVLDGKLIEALHVDQARKTIEKHESITKFEALL